MQLIILSPGLGKFYKKLNDELILSSFRMLRSPLSKKSFKQVCTIPLRNQYIKSKKMPVDSQMVQFLRKKLSEELKKIDQSADFHLCLHIYAHDATFGLSRSGQRQPKCFLSP